jgi:hypothetical protein
MSPRRARPVRSNWFGRRSNSLSGNYRAKGQRARVPPITRLRRPLRSRYAATIPVSTRHYASTNLVADFFCNINIATRRRAGQ